MSSISSLLTSVRSPMEHGCGRWWARGHTALRFRGMHHVTPRWRPADCATRFLSRAVITVYWAYLTFWVLRVRATAPALLQSDRASRRRRTSARACVMVCTYHLWRCGHGAGPGLGPRPAHCAKIIFYKNSQRSVREAMSQRGAPEPYALSLWILAGVPRATQLD